MPSSLGPNRRTTPPRSYDPSMKARDAELFEQVESKRAGDAQGAPQPFRQHLIDTPAAPIPPAIQGLLWATAAVVGVLLVLAALRMSQPTAPKKLAGLAAAVFSKRAERLASRPNLSTLTLPLRS